MNNKYAAVFYEAGIFHVYNRTNNRERLFATDENKAYFLKQYVNYMAPFADTFCWCLLPNHFHFLIQIKCSATIKQYLQALDIQLLKPIEKKYLIDKATLDEVVQHQWKRFFTSYAMAYNKQQNRTGNLFHRPFKRVAVDKDSYFTQAVIYVLANPLKHKVCTDFTLYKWSAWQSLISDKPTLLCREQLLEWFGGLKRFIDTVKDQSTFYYDSDIGIEDD
jgi:putative transposase